MRIRYWLLAALAFAVLVQESFAASQPFTMSLSTEKTVVKAGADVWVKVHLTNTSSRDMDLSASINDMIGIDPNYNIDVRDMSGNPGAKKHHDHMNLATGHGVFRSLKAGDSVTDEINVGRLYDFSTPGRYTIQISRQISENAKDGSVKSNAIRVTVTP